MIARLCYDCGKKWQQRDDEPLEIFCPACRYEQVKPSREQRDLRRLKEAVDG